MHLKSSGAKGLYKPCFSHNLAVLSSASDSSFNKHLLYPQAQTAKVVHNISLTTDAAF
jgi:hypothetical protein